MNQSAFHKLSYGVYICTTWDQGRPTGCVANSAMQITSNPATVAVSINHNNYTHDCIADCGYFAITVLSEKTKPLLIGTFGFSSGKEKDKFEGVNYSVRGKLPVLDDGCAYVVCKVIDKLETSTHTVFLGEVLDADILSGEEPMTYAYYHKVIKGKAPKTAPTYIEEKAEKARYVCDVCGYEYDGEVPFEELPEDWVCPVCSMGKEHFSKKS